jgi:hypothetical protein
MAALTLTGLAAATAAELPEPGVKSATPERPNVVLLGAIDSMLIAHPGDARAFKAGVREAFEPDFYLTDSKTGGSPRVSMALANRFRLVHGDPFGDEWQVRITIMGWMDWQGNYFSDKRLGPPRTVGGDSTGTRGTAPGLPDRVRGTRVNVTVLSPEAPETGARPFPLREDLIIDVFFEPRPASFSDAGRAAGLLAVEALHRRSGDLDPATRVRIDRTVRTPVDHLRSPRHR